MVLYCEEMDFGEFVCEVMVGMDIGFDIVFGFLCLVVDWMWLCFLLRNLVDNVLRYGVGAQWLVLCIV